MRLGMLIDLYRTVAHIENALIADDQAHYLRGSEAFASEVQPQ